MHLTSARPFDPNDELPVQLPVSATEIVGFRFGPHSLCERNALTCFPALVALNDTRPKRFLKRTRANERHALRPAESYSYQGKRG